MEVNSFILDSRRVLHPAPSVFGVLRNASQAAILGTILTKGSDVAICDLLAAHHFVEDDTYTPPVYSTVVVVVFQHFGCKVLRRACRVAAENARARMYVNWVPQSHTLAAGHQGTLNSRTRWQITPHCPCRSATAHLSIRIRSVSSGWQYSRHSEPTLTTERRRSGAMVHLLFAQAKVGDFDVALAVQQQIFQLEVAIDNVAFVQISVWMIGGTHCTGQGAGCERVD